MDKYPSEYNRYNKFIKDYCLKYSSKRSTYPEVILRYGTSGTGKSESWFNLQKENADDIFVLQFNDVPENFGLMVITNKNIVYLRNSSHQKWI